MYYGLPTTIARFIVFELIVQIEEKYLANRRGSEAHSEGAASFVGNLKLSSIQPPPGEFPTGSDPFTEEEEEKLQKDVLAPGANINKIGSS